MNRRLGRWARRWARLGLLGLGLIGVGRADELARPADAASEPVPILDAERLNLLSVEARGTGGYQVQISLKNQSPRPLRVVLPPGLVATAGQSGAGQSQDMGLGSPNNRAGGFGEPGRRSHADPSRSDPTDGPAPWTVTVPVGQTSRVLVPAVCMDFHKVAPSASVDLRLVDVDAVSDDPRVRRSLRALAAQGTSFGVAQAVMWSLRDGITPKQMLNRHGEINSHELALAARFLRVVAADAKLTGFDSGRLYVTVAAEPHAPQVVSHLAEGLRHQSILGMPVSVGARARGHKLASPALHLAVALKPGGDPTRATAGKIAVTLSSGADANAWSKFGEARFEEPAALEDLDAAGLARAIDRAMTKAFVTTRPGANGHSRNVHNALPFSLLRINFDGNRDRFGSARQVEVGGLGIGPGRTALVALPIPTGDLDHVELNGL